MQPELRAHEQTFEITTAVICKQQQDDDLLDLLDMFHAWMTEHLPVLNNRILTGSERIDYLVRALQPWVDRLSGHHASLTRSTRETALKALQLLGFAASSLERHARATGDQPGAGLARIPTIERLLVDLADTARVPPRDSIYTYWLSNRPANGPPLTFTGADGEILFNHVVNLTHDLHEDSCSRLRAVASGAIAVESPETVSALTSVAENTGKLCVEFRSFMKRLDDGTWAMEPRFFMLIMRQYLLSYSIDGNEWAGVNAAHEHTQICFDILTGTTLPFYLDYIPTMFRYFSPEAWRTIAGDLKCPSVLDQVLEATSLRASDVSALDERDLRRHLRWQSEPTRSTLLAYKRVIEVATTLTSIHWSLIYNYLIRPSQNLTADERARLGVTPDAGTGHRGHDQTQNIRKMRTEHPIISKLVRCVS